MEHRTISQFKVFKLILNPMHERTEVGYMVACSLERDKLIEYYNNELVPGGYEDMRINAEDNSPKRWYKQFKKNGPLELYNSVSNINELNSYDQGISYEWVNEDVFKTIQTPIV